MEPPLVIKRISCLISQISALHCKEVGESELECFKKASDAGLAPIFRGCTQKPPPNELHPDYNKWYFMYCDVWDFDLEGSESCGKWPLAHKEALADAVKRLPKMLDQLHSLEMVHGDIWSRNIILRQVCPPNRPDLSPKFEIAFVDFGLSATKGEQHFAGNNYFAQMQENDRANLRNTMCRMGELLDLSELRCGRCEKCN